MMTRFLMKILVSPSPPPKPSRTAETRPPNWRHSRQSLFLVKQNGGHFRRYLSASWISIYLHLSKYVCHHVFGCQTIRSKKEKSRALGCQASASASCGCVRSGGAAAWWNGADCPSTALLLDKGSRSKKRTHSNR